MHDRKKHLAKAIISEIVRQSGGRLESKTKLFKAFWKAHLNYARDRHQLLTDWPIIRMPHGPGIGDVDELTGSMMVDDELVVTDVAKGQFTAMAYELGLEPIPDELPEDMKAAVAEAVEWIRGKTANQLSNESHEASWQWRQLSDGMEMDIFLDLIPEEVYTEKLSRARGILAITA